MSTPETDLLTTTSYTIKEAAAVVGRSELTIRRRIDKGRFPSAELHRGSSGDEWRIPGADLAKVAQQDGWEINLDIEDDQSDDQPSTDLLTAIEAKIQAESKIELLSKDVQSLTDQVVAVGKERDQARGDLEYTKTELGKLEKELGEQTKAAAVAEARVDELRQRAEQAEKLRTEIAQDRDSLDQQHRELEKTSAESISALSNDLKSTKSDVEQAVGERDELAAKLAQAESSMGWWTHMRYKRKTESIVEQLPELTAPKAEQITEM